MIDDIACLEPGTRLTTTVCIVGGGGIISFVTFFFMDLWALDKVRKHAALRDGRKF